MAAPLGRAGDVPSLWGGDREESWFSLLTDQGGRLQELGTPACPTVRRELSLVLALPGSGCSVLLTRLVSFCAGCPCCPRGPGPPCSKSGGAPDLGKVGASARGALGCCRRGSRASAAGEGGAGILCLPTRQRALCSRCEQE